MSRLDEALARLERAVARLEAILSGGKDAHRRIEAESENRWPHPATGESDVAAEDNSARLGRESEEGIEE